MVSVNALESQILHLPFHQSQTGEYSSDLRQNCFDVVRIKCTTMHRVVWPILVNNNLICLQLHSELNQYINCLEDSYVKHKQK